MTSEKKFDVNDAWKESSAVLAALGSVTRQRIIMMFESSHQLNIKAIADQFNLSRTAVVHHIGVLQDAGILKSERIGKEVVLDVDWRLISDTLEKVQAHVAPMAEAG